MFLVTCILSSATGFRVSEELARHPQAEGWTKLKARSSISARQIHLSRKVVRRPFQIQHAQIRPWEEKLLEVRLSTRPPKLLSRDHHDLLAVPRNYLQPLRVVCEGSGGERQVAPAHLYRQ